MSGLWYWGNKGGEGENGSMRMRVERMGMERGEVERREGRRGGEKEGGERRGRRLWS